MFLQIIRLEGTGRIRLGNIHLYDLKNKLLEIPEDVKVFQSSNLEENIGNNISRKIQRSEATNPLENKDTKTTGTENGWWEIDLGRLIEVNRIVIGRTNVGKIICMNDQRIAVFSETRDGYFSYEYFPDYIIDLPKLYSLSVPVSLECIDGVIYTYQKCINSDLIGCPPVYNNVLPKEVINDIKKTSNSFSFDTSGKEVWGVIDKKECLKINTYDLVDPSEWSECNGTQRLRQWKKCKDTSKNCPDKLPYLQVQNCRDSELVWSKWSECADNKKIRNAECTEGMNGGKPCPDARKLIQEQACTNVKLSEWSDWSVCNGNQRTKTRTCEDGTNGGVLCKDLDDSKPLKVSQSCSDGKLSKWSEWSECNQGEQSRQRFCIEPINGGSECPKEEMTQTQKCSNGTLTQWSEWSKCDGAQRTRSRKCIEPTGNGAMCPYEPLYESQPCKNIWSECTLSFSQTNENHESRTCTPVNSIMVAFFIVLVLLIVIHILTRR